MGAIQRTGDANSAGDIVTALFTNVKINGQDVSVNGSPVSAHPCCGQPGCGIHCGPVTAGGLAGSVMAGGLPINIAGNADTCGHPRAGGSGDVNAG